MINGVNRPLPTSNLIENKTFPFPTRLNAVILTGEKETYSKGLPQFLAAIDTDNILVLPGSGKVTASRSVDEGEMQPAILYMQTGQSYNLGQGAALTIRQTGEACADIEVVYNAFQIWLAQCPLIEDSHQPWQSKDWSVISLSQAKLGKTDIASLGDVRSALTVSSTADPGLLTHSNWLKVDPDMTILISSDGRRMSIGTSNQ